MQSGIYKIENTVTGSAYVGSAVNLRKRWKTHRSALRNSGKAPPKLLRAWEKYGEAAFEFSKLEACAPEKLLEREQHYIDTLKPRYNTRPVAHSNFGVRWDADTNRKKGRVRKTFVVRGVRGSLRELTERFGVVAQATARWRMYRGWEVEAAFLTPTLEKTECGSRGSAGRDWGVTGVHREAFGVTANLKTLHEMFGVTGMSAFKGRLRRGWDLEKALTKKRRGQND